MSTTRLKLTVIEGGGEARPKLLRLPQTVVGPSPFSKSLRGTYRISEAEVRKALSNNRRQPALDLWSMVLGELPPMPNVSRYSATVPMLKQQALPHAHAAFRGVRRPVGDDTRGFDHVVFITKPCVHFIYEPDMVCMVKPQEIPADVVLATYVKLDFPDGRPNSARSKVAINGIITHWELVESDGLLPVQSSERYRKRLW